MKTLKYKSDSQAVLVEKVYFVINQLLNFFPDIRVLFKTFENEGKNSQLESVFFNSAFSTKNCLFSLDGNSDQLLQIIWGFLRQNLDGFKFTYTL